MAPRATPRFRRTASIHLWALAPALMVGWGALAVAWFKPIDLGASAAALGAVLILALIAAWDLVAERAGWPFLLIGHRSRWRWVQPVGVPAAFLAGILLAHRYW